MMFFCGRYPKMGIYSYFLCQNSHSEIYSSGVFVDFLVNIVYDREVTIVPIL